MNPSKVLPPAAGRVLERERLLHRLLAWEDKKLVIIHGPAGQGKSTLAAEYLRALSAPAAWYTLDREDENPLLFISGLGEALRRVHPVPLPDLPSSPRYRYGIAGARTAVLGWIGRVFGSLPGPCRVVLDDLHTAADAPALGEVLNHLLTATPTAVRFLLVSRSRPRLDIARLRARHAVGEISGQDLKFSADEAFHFFTGVCGTQISRRDAESINRLAEGWPAGLVLMHEYLSAGPHAVVELLTGRRAHPEATAHIFDYLAQEVFAHLSPGMQNFLLRTSIVDHLTPDLMETLHRLPPREARDAIPAQAMVDELLRKNLFVAVSDDGAPVVRYHVLFREFLRKRLLAVAKPAEVNRLYAAGARHFRKAGDMVRTVDLHLASRQYRRAVDLIESSGRSLIMTGHAQTLTGWLDALPPKFRELPWLLFFRAVALRFVDPRTALSLFEQALAGFREDRTVRRRDEGVMFSLGGVIEACFYAGGDVKRVGRAAAETEQLLKRAQKATAEARTHLLLASGMAHFLTGDLRESAGALSRSLDLFRRRKDFFSQVQSAIYLVPCAVYLGDFALAREAARRGFEALGQIPGEKGGEAALHAVHAMTALNEGNFEEARESVERSSALARQYGFEPSDFLSLDVGGWLKTAMGEHEEAELLLAECRRKGRELGNDFFGASASHLLSLNALHQGRLAKARDEAASSLRVKAWSGSKLFRGISLAVLGAVDLKLGSFSLARKELHQALRVLREIGAAQQEADVLLLLAKVALLTGKDRTARDYLETGFRIGQERGFTYYGAIAPGDLSELARKAMGSGICVDYCETLLQKHLKLRIAPAIRIHSLGRFKVFRGKRPIPDAELKSRQAKTLLKLLVANEDRKLSRDLAMDILWPNAAGDSGLRNFTVLLHRVRKVLESGRTKQDGESFIFLGEDHIALNRERVWTDVSEFRSLVGTAGQRKANKDGEAALKYYEKAFDLYKGDFLSDDQYEDWPVPVREMYRTMYLKALDDAAGVADSSDRKGGARACYEKLFFADPGNEKACRWLMAHHVANGSRADAVRTYERCQRALAEELDTEPGEETRRLYRGIIGG